MYVYLAFSFQGLTYISMLAQCACACLSPHWESSTQGCKSWAYITRGAVKHLLGDRLVCPTTNVKDRTVELYHKQE